MMPRLAGVKERTHQPFYDTIIVRWWWRNRVTAWLLRKVFRRVDPRDAYLTPYEVRLMLDGLIRRDVQ